VFYDVHGTLNQRDRPMVGKPVEDALAVAPRKHHAGALKQLQVAADDRRVLVKVRRYLAEALFTPGQ
jgi:hypothetical protein